MEIYFHNQDKARSGHVIYKLFLRISGWGGPDFPYAEVFPEPLRISDTPKQHRSEVVADKVGGGDGDG